jgi:hypothetical protein
MAQSVQYPSSPKPFVVIASLQSAPFGSANAAGFYMPLVFATAACALTSPWLFLCFLYGRTFIFPAFWMMMRARLRLRFFHVRCTRLKATLSAFPSSAPEVKASSKEWTSLTFHSFVFVFEVLFFMFMRLLDAMLFFCCHWVSPVFSQS